ncbi:Zn-ribbon domain-containing OB-fold protein [Faunimonas sp. B44]|uniref:Zn-ribbon domain-containing OB-fold protein n=1 Tax=Faunimonas sp. B44 TaxID=3461493 RepID=UPI004043E163
MAGPRLYSPYDQTMWESIAEDRMRMQRCGECGTFRYPPGACCPNCLSTEADWEEVSGRGKVLSWITYHKQYLPAYPAPTTIVAAMLDEGQILITNIDRAETPKLALDRPVRLIYGDHPDGYRIPRFTIDEQPAS